MRLTAACQLPVVARVNKLQIGCPSCDPQLTGQYESIVVMSVDQLSNKRFNTTGWTTDGINFDLWVISAVCRPILKSFGHLIAHMRRFF